MPAFEIIPYRPDLKREWDAFIDRSKNATFLFKRDYMDYHAHRFTDHSFLFMRDGKPTALLPASIDGHTVSSHGGLTYGGLLTDRKATGEDVLQMFTLLKSHLLGEGTERLVYKPVPHIYHRIPAEEDLYALFRIGATLDARLISCTIRQDERIKFRDIRKSGILKARNIGITLNETDEFSAFWNILEDNLMSKYGAMPVHSLAEISMLSKSFPSNIKLHQASLGNKVLAGVVIYLCGNVAHTQYISASGEGKESGALDLLFDHLINDVYRDVEYFDFGTSNEKGGTVLNGSLLYQKEGFGGRAICYDTYTVDLKQTPDDKIS